MKQTTFQCSCCGETLYGPPMAWHFDAEAWSSLSPDDRKLCGELSSDQCVIDNEHFFVRGLVEIPVLDRTEPFAWGVWVSLSKMSFERTCDLWESPKRTDEPPYFGWFNNSIPGYPATLHLKTAVHSRPVGVRPYIELEAKDHPLALEQRNGITMARIKEMAEQMHHHNSTLTEPKRKWLGLF